MFFVLLLCLFLRAMRFYDRCRDSDGISDVVGSKRYEYIYNLPFFRENHHHIHHHRITAINMEDDENPRVESLLSIAGFLTIKEEIVIDEKIRLH
jgi:hypothetical protein